MTTKETTTTMMTITNKTLWNTAHLKAILQQAAEIELEVGKRKRVRVTVEYTRGHDSSGCAYIGGTQATVRIRHPQSRAWFRSEVVNGVRVPRPINPTELEDLKLRFASVAAHEFAHLRGQGHDTMSAKYKWHGNWREYVSWAAAMPLAVKAPKSAKAKPTVEAKLAHVLKMKAQAETRVKRATTILRKWKARERYYAKAAQKAQQTTS